MRILFYFGHPAQFHFYKNTIIELEKSHKISIFIKSKDILEKLLQKEVWQYENLNPTIRGNSRIEIAWALLKRILRLAKNTLKIKPDLMISSDPSVSIVGFIFGIPTLNFIDDDYDSVGMYSYITYPFINTIITPTSVRVGRWEGKRVSYDGYMKLAYLHPRRFKPDVNRIQRLKSKQYSMVRLAKLTAHHDDKASGVSFESLGKIIKLLENKGEVIISSEVELPVEFKKYSYNLAIDDIHHYLFYAKILVSDSQSMSGEAAILGTPSIRISTFKGKLSVLDELEDEYNLTHAFDPNDESSYLKKIKHLINEPDLDFIYNKRKLAMLKDKIDVAGFTIWFITNYPNSVKIMRSTPDFLLKFK